MKIYFLSSLPATLTLNETYFGFTDTFERFAEISLKDNIFVRFTPQNALPISFFLTEDIRFTPPNGVEVYLLRDGIALYARDFPPSDFTLRPLAQERVGNLLATLVMQGHLQLMLQSPDGFFVATLPPAFEKSTLSFHGDFLFVETQNRLTIFNARGENVFMENILSYEERDGELNALLPLSDRFQRTAKCSYRLSGTTCTRTQFTIQQAQLSEHTADELIPYAFFESVLIGANFEHLLCDELASKKDKLVQFLGKFESVILTEEPNTCGLIRKKDERLFETAYFTVTLENGKIVDIRG